MKKATLLFLMLTLALSTSTFAQGDFKAGAHLGLPIGDAGDLATFAIAVDLGYLFEISDDFSAGPTLGYSHSFGDEIDAGLITVEVDDVQFLPIGGEARYAFDDFFVGGGLGYAIGINDGNDGGFYYSPRFGYNVSDKVTIMAAYRGVSVDGGSWDIITAGVEVNLN
ncbi:outer membrane beta-barrel protein [Muricauda sp. JGD-17]|uniref:Outer membrane beta-barrel protein n=1 Tax=Flagellimonas ochracea TaxID=2696472 RepID=A0A964TAN6_9FLAO|nr:outer membrane beta-barrel protein [Allomuricauda ochracea]NAY90794.1 outer membrane beta-barrel protein [Allomuricauda ochracea]